MPEVRQVPLSVADLRAVTAFAAHRAETVLELFEHAAPGDPRPRRAIEEALRYAGDGRRDRTLRDVAWAARRAATDCGDPVGAHAARAASAAPAAAFLHPIARATQVHHVLGSAALAARAAELAAGDDPAVGEAWVRETAPVTPRPVVDVLVRYPAAPQGGGRVGELTRLLDELLRRSAQ